MGELPANVGLTMADVAQGLRVRESAKPHGDKVRPSIHVPTVSILSESPSRIFTMSRSIRLATWAKRCTVVMEVFLSNTGILFADEKIKLPPFLFVFYFGNGYFNLPRLFFNLWGMP